jgi:RimJ/RimL family protein N-acetyltransferase
MDFSLRLLGEEDVPALQRVYEAATAGFTGRSGHPPDPDQAAMDFTQGLAEPGRFQFGVFLGGSLIGAVDCKLASEVEGRAHIGLLLLVEPYNDPAIASLAMRILVRWLVEQFGVHRLETSVAAHRAIDIAFWEAEGFRFTGEQYRQDVGSGRPRFLVMARDA